MISNAMALRYARAITNIQREFLKQHIDARVPINRQYDTQPRRALLSLEYIAYTQKSGCAATGFPTHTRLTELGRAVVCAVMADEVEEETEIEMAIADDTPPPPAPIPSPPVVPVAPIGSVAERKLFSGWTASKS